MNATRDWFADVPGKPLAVLVITNLGVKLEDAGVMDAPEDVQVAFFHVLPDVLRRAADDYADIGTEVFGE